MLIGRKKQQAELWEAYNSDDSKFVALYGRRRVGKTYLIKQTFKDKFTFLIPVLLMGLCKSNCMVGVLLWRTQDLLRLLLLSIGWRLSIC